MTESPAERTAMRAAIFFAGFIFLLMLLAATVRADAIDAALSAPERSEADRQRDVHDHPAELLRLLRLEPGMTVADVVAGEGYYSEILSRVVGPKGHVLLINNASSETWNDGLDARLAGNRLPNVQRETLDLNVMSLPPRSLDAVLLIKAYHDLYWVDPKGKWPKIDVGGVLDQLARALKPSGRLLLVDHSAREGHGTSDAGTLHRIEEAYAIKDFEAHGFRLDKKSDVLRMPLDRRDEVSYKAPMLGKTDKFVLVFSKR